MRQVRIPKLEKHPVKNVAYVRLPMPDGKRKVVSLGAYGTPEAQKRYDETIALWIKGEIKAEPPEERPSPSDPVPQANVHATGQLYCHDAGMVGRAGLSRDLLVHLCGTG